MILLVLIITGPLTSFCINFSFSTQLYVVSLLSSIANDGDGSITHPYSSVQHALDHIEREYYHSTVLREQTTIHLYPTYHFVNTIHFKKSTQSHTIDNNEHDRHSLV